MDSGGAGAIADEATLELGDGADDMEHQLAAGGRGVDRFGEGAETDRFLLQATSAETNVASVVSHLGEPTLVPCTPRGIMYMLDEYGVDPKGKDAVIIGRSNIVGKPAALLLMMRHATITICHSRTQNLAGKVAAADIVVAAIGRTEFVRGDWIKDGAVVIDVGMNRTEAGLKGDVQFDEAKKRASLITPVPGGVGLMTITMLLDNTLIAARARVS